MVEKFKKLKQTIQYHWKDIEVGEQAAQLTFYILLSLVPMLLVVGNLVPLLPISYESISDYLEPILPPTVFELVTSMLKYYLHSYSGSSLSLGIIVALWSSSQAFNVLQRVFNKIFHATDRSNFLVTRLFSFIMSIIFVLTILTVGLVLAFGGTVLRLLQQFTLIREGIDVIFDNFKWIVAFIILFSVLVAIYHIVPNVKRAIGYALPGALFATGGILIASQLYSVYVSNATNNALTDGTIGVFIVLMLWLYVISMVLLLGAWLNVFVYDYKNPPSAKKELYEVKMMKEVYYSKEFRNRKGETHE